MTTQHPTSDTKTNKLFACWFFAILLLLNASFSFGQNQNISARTEAISQALRYLSKISAHINKNTSSDDIKTMLAQQNYSLDGYSIILSDKSLSLIDTLLNENYSLPLLNDSKNSDGVESGFSIDYIDPSTANTSGGNTISMLVSSINSGATVKFGGASGSNVTVSSSGAFLTVKNPPHAAGTVDITITNPDGQSITKQNAFTYTDIPSVNYITPSTGNSTGGNTISMLATSVLSGATVKFGGIAGSNVSVSQSGAFLTVTNPSHAIGLVDVTVANPDGRSATKTNAFTYTAIPSIDYISPSTGNITGGNTISILVSNVLNGATVRFGEVTGSNVSVSQSGSFLTVKNPSHVAGVVDVTITNPDGQSATKQNAFTYTSLPSIDYVDPSIGNTIGGNTISMLVSNAISGASVKFGGIAGSNVSVSQSGSFLTVTNPSHSAGTIDITITNPDGQSTTKSNAFTYTGVPSIGYVSPPSGNTIGGNAISILVTSVLNGASIRFGGILGSNVSVSSSGAFLTVTNPPHAAGIVDIAITNPDGQSTTKLNAFTYNEYSMSTINAITNMLLLQ